ncbi:MAG: metallophosphoesterase [Nocardioidaceae bacterium]
MEWVRRAARWRPARGWRLFCLHALGWFFGWAVVAVPVAYHGFMTDSRPSVIAGHDVQVAPTRDGYITADLGAYLPNLRYPTDQLLGVRLVVGKTNLDSYEALLQRYALIGAHPEGAVDKIRGVIIDMLAKNALQGAVIGLAGPLAWVLLGRRRRHELWVAATPRRLGAGAVGLVVVGLVTTSVPFDEPPRRSVASSQWVSAQQMFPEANVTGRARKVEIQAGLITSGTKRLVSSAFDSFDRAKTFYTELVDKAPHLADKLRQPQEGDTVALLISDRHDNVGMDPVIRAIAKAGGATVLFDAGDDTSTGGEWETFSLDSLADAVDEFDQRYVSTGNHDEGAFVGRYLGKNDFIVLEGEPITTPDGITMLGVPDPRSSGLGTWRDVSGISLADQGEELADTACASADDGERVSTLLVHDASLGAEALQRGCVDLVLAGHLHTQVGPSSLTGENGHVGVSYTNGTTGGAAYAIALGSKLRRQAEVTFVTYHDGKPIGLQPVKIRTTGKYAVTPFTPLPLPSDDTGG